jgi:hypothetical protein
VTVALYATIWSAMILFVAGEMGKGRTELAEARAWRAWAAGAVLCAAHIAIAMSVRHGWNHDDAVRETAARAAGVYGFGWRGSLYVNYAFLVVWIAEIVWWAASAATYVQRPALVTWLLRTFYAIIIINAVVIFASPGGRVAGVLLSIWLAWVWSRSTGLPAPQQASGRTARSYRES